MTFHDGLKLKHAKRDALAALSAPVPVLLGISEAAEEASELVPLLGDYPTERHYYKSVVIDHLVPGRATDLAAAPAVGAIITFAQSWFAQGVTLGNLLHSVALAPGESTQVAVIDGSRRMSVSGQEATVEAERLTNASTHSRAISEVREAVAAKTATTAESFPSSAGAHNLSASRSQSICDATQQATAAVRERRAAMVKEVSESEHERVSTRILANDDPMHTLTVQYFEMIEIYRVMVQVQLVERCLFVPMRLIDASAATPLLPGFSFEGIPAADLIDSNPVMVAGNYLVFRMPAFAEARGVPSGRDDADTPLAKARRAWQGWLTECGLTLGAESAAEQLVPIPTGGVFAETVLSRSNSAEKIDAARYWNDQDPPIPLPEISAIQMAPDDGRRMRCPI